MTNGRVEVITSVERRRRWSSGEKQQLVAATLEAGASVSSIARVAGIHPSQLYGWRRRKISIPPDVAELVDACDAIHAPVRRRLEREAIARMAARGLPPPRATRTPEEQAAVDAQVERAREMFDIPAGGLVQRSGGGQGFPPRARDLTSVSAIAAAVINRAAPD